MKLDLARKSLFLSFPYFVLVFFISSIDYEARANSLFYDLNLFDLLTREPFFLFELYLLNSLFGESAITIARMINIFISIFFILILTRKDDLTTNKELLLIYNPISFFLIFNINAQLIATLCCYWVYRNHNKSFAIAMIAPLFHLIGLVAIGIYFFRKSLFLIPLSIFLIGFLIFESELLFFILNTAYLIFDFIIYKLITYTAYETNILHTIFTFSLISISFFILCFMQKVSLRFLMFFISVFFLSFLSIDYKFFSRLIFSFEFLLLYEIIFSYGLTLRRNSGLIFKKV